MYSRKAIPIAIILLLALVVSYAGAANQDSPAAYRLIVSDNEETSTPLPKQSDPLPVEKIYSAEGYQPEGNTGQGCYSQGCGEAGCYGESCGEAGFYGKGIFDRCCNPRWTATADAIFLDRISGKTIRIMSPETFPPDGLSTNDFDFGFRAGPRLSLIRHVNSCYDVELMYFMVDGWDSFRSIDVGGIALDPFNFDWSSKLYNGELNLRWNPSCRMTVLAGFRWSEVKENIELSSRIAVSDFVLSSHNGASTKNDLYGFQLGTDVKLVGQRCFSVNGLLKAGVFGNSAGKTSTTSLAIDDNPPVTTSTSVATSRIAFIGEAGLQACYQVTNRLALRAGYQVMWLDGVATAAAQGAISSTEIDTDDTIFYHGANAGLEYCF